MNKVVNHAFLRKFIIPGVDNDALVCAHSQYVILGTEPEEPYALLRESGIELVVRVQDIIPRVLFLVNDGRVLAIVPVGLKSGYDIACPLVKSVDSSALERVDVLAIP